MSRGPCTPLPPPKRLASISPRPRLDVSRVEPREPIETSWRDPARYGEALLSREKTRGPVLVGDDRRGQPRAVRPDGLACSEVKVHAVLGVEHQQLDLGYLSAVSRPARGWSGRGSRARQTLRARQPEARGTLRRRATPAWPAHSRLLSEASRKGHRGRVQVGGGAQLLETGRRRR